MVDVDKDGEGRITGFATYRNKETQLRTKCDQLILSIYLIKTN